MKKLVIFVLIFIAFYFSVNNSVVFAGEQASQEETIDKIISGINESDFENLIEIINELLGENLTLKEVIIKFLTGDISININGIFSYFKSKINGFFTLGGKLIIYVLIIGLVFNLANIISSKNADNNAKYVINFIAISISVTIIFKVIESVFLRVETQLNNLTKITEVIFPVMFSVSGLIGDFGVTLIKPFTAFLSVIVSALSFNFFIPLLRMEASLSVLSNLSDTVKLDGLKKSVSSFFKWSLLLISGLYSLMLGGQSLVNAQYNGVSVKILKYITGSVIPIVGGFLSGGMEVLISSAVLIKNSIGLIALIYILLTVILTAVEILIFSLLIKFMASLFEPVVDAKYYKLIIGVTDGFNSLVALLFVCGFIFILTVLFTITATSNIF